MTPPADRRATVRDLIEKWRKHGPDAWVNAVPDSRIRSAGVLMGIDLCADELEAALLSDADGERIYQGGTTERVHGFIQSYCDAHGYPGGLRAIPLMAVLELLTVLAADRTEAPSEYACPNCGRVLKFNEWNGSVCPYCDYILAERTRAEATLIQKCQMCGKWQPCPEHGRTPVTEADYAELRTDVASQIAAIDAEATPPAERLRETAQALVTKLDECAPYITGVFVLQAARGYPYKGPNYATELDKLRAALREAETPAQEKQQETK